MNRTLILVRGLSGSGKTWLSDMIVGDSPTRVMICADDYFINDKGDYQFDYTKIKEAHEWCISETRETLEEEHEIVCVHNNFTRKWEAEPYFKMAEELGYKVQVISLYDSGMNDKDLAERSPHTISEKAIQKQRHQWELDIHPHRASRPKRSPFHNAPHHNNNNMPYVVVYDQAPPHFQNQGNPNRRHNNYRPKKF